MSQIDASDFSSLKGAVERSSNEELVAAKLGFRLQRNDRLLVADVPVPEPAEPPQP